MNYIKLYSKDNVVIATENLKKGTEIIVEGEKIKLLDDVPTAHKIAIKNFKKGEEIVKYENVIGIATQPIMRGQWVHMHNLATLAGREKEYTYNFNKEAIFPGTSDKTFMGYSRNDGSAGIRNYVAVISTVFCSNGTNRDICDVAKKKYPTNKYFDGFLSLTQEFGCSQSGDDLERQAKTIAGIIQNGNFGGVLLVSLGCEIMVPELIEKHLGDYDKSRIKTVVTQEVTDEVEVAISMIDEIMQQVSQDRRTPINVNRLHIAMNCGGSDGYSGITANKLVGDLCDILVAEGATMNMTEVPEMMGAEHILMNRCASESVFKDMVEMLDNYMEYFNRYHENPNANATQGNHAGGLTTIEDKSLGCIQKGGHCAVMEVLDYGERATKNGYVLISGPGNDLAGITAQVAAGAVMVIFTTGRGTPAGFCAPTFRLSSNTALAERKPQWIDYDAGRLLGTSTSEDVKELDDELYDMILATANGQYHTHSEINDYWMLGCLKDGITL